MLIISPKRVADEAEAKFVWYNYYAGYSHTFTQKAIETAGIPDGGVVLDPWNGAGTTTFVSSVNGYQSKGVDLNPVMRVIATAKQATKDDVKTVLNILKTIGGEVCSFVGADDPLGSWFGCDSVEIIRSVEFSILKGETYQTTDDKVLSLTSAQCLMYTALFNCVRSYLSVFIPSNPTWIKKPKEGSDKVGFSWSEFEKRFLSFLTDMLNEVSTSGYGWSPNMSEIVIGSSTSLDVESSSIDFVLTSPPYCTRIDYGVATLPELSILCVGGGKEVDSIRRALMGTTTVPRSVTGRDVVASRKCIEFIESVRLHYSKASHTYYYKNFVQYFYDLSLSVGEVFRVLKPGAKFVCVVQDSYYKDLHCDLPGILVEMAEFHGMRLLDNFEFESKRNMVNLNMRSKSYRGNSAAYENVLIFEKEVGYGK